MNQLGWLVVETDTNHGLWLNFLNYSKQIRLKCSSPASGRSRTPPLKIVAEKVSQQRIFLQSLQKLSVILASSIRSAKDSEETFQKLKQKFFFHNKYYFSPTGSFLLCFHFFSTFFVFWIFHNALSFMFRDVPYHVPMRHHVNM